MAAPSHPFPLQHDTILFGQEELFRWLDHLYSEGVIAPTDGAVTQYASGEMRVNVAAGQAICTFDTPYGGKRQLRWTATSSGTPGSPNSADNWISTFTAAHGTLPRIDRVVATVQDASLDATGQRRQVFQVVAGTATSGATLANLTGAAAVPANSMLLANVLVRAAATTILTADIDTTVRTRTRVGGGAVLASTAISRTPFVAPVPITATSEATAQTIVTAPAASYDGVTEVEVEFFCPYVSHSGGNGVILFIVHDGTASVGHIAGQSSPTASTRYLGPRASAFLTPSGSVTYSIRAYTGGGTGTVGADVGGSGLYVPGFLRIKTP